MFLWTMTSRDIAVVKSLAQFIQAFFIKGKNTEYVSSYQPNDQTHNNTYPIIIVG